MLIPLFTSFYPAVICKISLTIQGTESDMLLGNFLRTMSNREVTASRVSKEANVSCVTSICNRTKIIFSSKQSFLNSFLTAYICLEHLIENCLYIQKHS